MTRSIYRCTRCKGTRVYSDAYVGLNDNTDVRVFDATFCDDCGKECSVEEVKPKILTVRTYCTATVEETWTFEVPDDFVIDDEASIGEIDDDPRVRYINVENTKVDDERDRSIVEISISDMEEK